MANQNVKMSKFKRAFQLLAANVPQREICEKLHMGRSVLTRYKNIVDERKISYLGLSRMSNEDIEQFLISQPSLLRGLPVAGNRCFTHTRFLADVVL